MADIAWVKRAHHLYKPGTGEGIQTSEAVSGLSGLVSSHDAEEFNSLIDGDGDFQALAGALD